MIKKLVHPVMIPSTSTLKQVSMETNTAPCVMEQKTATLIVIIVILMTNTLIAHLLVSLVVITFQTVLIATSKMVTAMNATLTLNSNIMVRARNASNVKPILSTTTPTIMSATLATMLSPIAWNVPTRLNPLARFATQTLN